MIIKPRSNPYLSTTKIFLSLEMKKIFPNQFPKITFELTLLPLSLTLIIRERNALIQNSCHQERSANLTTLLPLPSPKTRLPPSPSSVSQSCKAFQYKSTLSRWKITSSRRPLQPAIFFGEPDQGVAIQKLSTSPGGLGGG